MKLFAKEKGIILLILNAILVIWILSATVIAVSNVTTLAIKDYEYTYEEYKISYCDFEYDSEEDCENSYIIYKLDQKSYDIEYKRSIVISLFNIALVSGVLFILNKDRKSSK